MLSTVRELNWANAAVVDCLSRYKARRDDWWVEMANVLARAAEACAQVVERVEVEVGGRVDVPQADREIASNHIPYVPSPSDIEAGVMQTRLQRREKRVRKREARLRSLLAEARETVRALPDAESLARMAKHCPSLEDLANMPGRKEVPHADEN